MAVILDQLAEGESWDDVLAGYPELTREDIQAVLLYAKSSLDHADGDPFKQTFQVDSNGIIVTEPEEETYENNHRMDYIFVAGSHAAGRLGAAAR